MLKKIFLILFALVFYYCDSHAWNAETTHKELSENAAHFSVLNITKGDYLKNLGFNDNLDEAFIFNGESKTTKDWIGKIGGVLEDEGGTFSGRFYNHFHNPIFSYSQWSDAGLTSAWPWVKSGNSAILWAVDDSSNDWRWAKVRGYYYKALTSSADADRQANFAQTLRGLGQIIHLIQDMAQPAHVRNDPHPADDRGADPGFEYWAKRSDNQLVVADLMSKPIYPAVSLNTTVGGYPPITRFFDTGQYDGTNPSSSLSLGLAEYTNANFVSEDTIFKDFAYPRREDMVVFAESQNKTLNGFEVYRKYFEKVGGGEPVKHFTTASRFYAYLLDDPSPSLQGFDDRCYKDYADLLIPRAVGYSAALINYFFRGQIDMTVDSGQYVIKNESDEAMSGAFRLYYDDKYDMRKQVPAAEWNLSIPANGKSSPVTFTAPSDAKEPGKYMLVFLGTHGAESGAVVGKSIELKNDLDIRIVTVSNYVSQWDDRRGEIKVFTDNGVITGKIPKEMFYKAIKVRFDVSNPNAIGILVSLGNEFKIYRYKIDENNNSLIYEKTVFEQLRTKDEPRSSKLVNEDSEIFSYPGYPTYKSISQVTIEWSSYSDFNVIDFYLEGEEVKAFYGVHTYTNEYEQFVQYYCYYPDLSCSENRHSEYGFTLDYGFREERTEIFYGNDQVASYRDTCSGGGLQENGSYRGCTNEPGIHSLAYPIAILNKNYFSYGTTDGKLVSTLPFDLSKYIINPSALSTNLANGKVRLNSHLSKGDSYSFNLIQNWTGISFSSSLGVLKCGGMLVTDRQMDGGYVTRKDFGFSVLKSCDDFKEINAPSFSINAQEVSDFYVK